MTRTVSGSRLPAKEHTMTIDLHNPSPTVIEAVAQALMNNSQSPFPKHVAYYMPAARVAIAALAGMTPPEPPGELDLTIAVHKAMQRVPKGPASQALAAIDAVRVWDRQNAAARQEDGP